MKTFSLRQLIVFATLSFVAGAVIGIVAYEILTPKGTGTGSTISAPQANSAFKTYMTKPEIICDTIKGYNITTEQVGVMYSMMSASLKGFRIYHGVDPSTRQEIGIVVGVDLYGKDVASRVGSTVWGASGMCPIICDVSSPITSM